MFMNAVLSAPPASNVSTMSWIAQVAVPLLTAFLAFTGIWYQGRRKRVGEIKQIDQAIEIYNALPESAVSREKLVEHIDSLVMDLVLARSKLRRDGSGASLAVIFLAVGGWLSYLASSGGWSDAYWIPAAFFVIFGVAGFFESISKRERDAGGSKRKKEGEEEEQASAK